MRKLKLLIAACALLLGAGQTWATDYVTNGDNLTYTKRIAGNPTSADVKESWCDNATQAFDLSQELTTLPAGVYTLSLQAMYRASLESGTPTNCVVYAATDGSYYDSPLANFGDVAGTAESLGGVTTAMETATNYKNTLPYFVVAEDNATVRVGARSIGALTRCTNGYWFIWKTSSFNVSDVTDAEVLATALADVKAEAKAILDAADDGDEKTAFQSIYDAATATGSSIAALKKAIKTYAGTMGTATTPLDVTSIYVNNGDFSQGIAMLNDNNNVLNLAPMGWTNTDSGTGQYNFLSIVANNATYDSQSNFAYNGKTTGNCLYMRHAWGASTMTSTQTITLPEGRYKVTVPAKKTGSTATVGFSFADETENNDVTTSWVAYEKTFDATSTNNTLTITLSFTHPSGGGQRAFFDGVTLIAYGDPLKAIKAELKEKQDAAVALLGNSEYSNVVGTERTELSNQSTATAASETIAAYQDVIDDVQDAIDAFTAAKTNYDANAAEVTKATALGVDPATISTYTAGSSTTAAIALSNTQNLKVVEYNYVTTNYAHGVTLGEWVSSGSNNGANFNNEHWSGTQTNYKNQDDSNGQGWNSSSWDMNYNQDVILPAGNYVFKVAGRQAQSNQVDMSLVVKKGEESIGTVNDFPHNGNSARGIDKTGATKFEGENSEFAHDGAGYGWEWRYVKFTLTEDATVNIAVKVIAKAKYMWASFGDYTLQTDNEANISLIAYNIALESAQTTIANTDYKNVTGEEKTTLQNAIDADATLDKTDNAAIVAATTALNEAVTNFTEAKSAYDAFVEAKAVEYADDQPYAAAEKYTAIGTAQAATATNASDATTITNAIISAYRRYVESNALAEGVTGAENKTSLISDPNMDVTYDPTNHTFGAWQVFSQVDGTISLKTEDDQPLTDSEGNKYKYADIWKTDNNGGIKQTINLPAGKYLLTAAARAQDASGATFGLFAGNARTEISRIGNTGGVFGNGWNDAYVEFFVPTTSDVEIGVQSGNGKTMWWGATRFRLVRLGDAIETVSVSNAGMATLCSAYPLDFTGKDVKAYTASLTGEEGNKTVLLTRVYQVPANTGLVLKGAEGSYEIPVIASADDIEGNLMVGTLTVTNVEASTEGSYNYMLADGDNGVGFYYVAQATTSAAGKAYLHTEEALKKEYGGTGSRIALIFSDDATGISNVNADNGKAVYYDLQGRQVSKPSKGMYIINGKKVIK